ncbi:MAG: hypothetical protein U9Q70_04315 [Chloroflexota bacterium]|nr:hypothetical protein [Chloroflexota bacterium]
MCHTSTLVLTRAAQSYIKPIDLASLTWDDHPPTTFTFDKYLGSGHHYIKVEYV